MESAAKILCVSPDPILLQTRRWILEGYFQVDSAGRVSEAAAMIESQNYDLILLCYSLRAEECRQVHDLVRANASRTLILALIERRDGCAEAYSDQQIPVGDGPYALLRKVAGMIAPSILQKLKRGSRLATIETKIPSASAANARSAVPFASKTV